MVFYVENEIVLNINNKKVCESKFIGNPVFATDIDISPGTTQTKLNLAITERKAIKAIGS